MFVTSLFVATAILYAISCGLFLVYLFRGHDSIGEWSMRTLAAAGALQVAYVLGDWMVLSNLPFRSIHGTLEVASLLVVVAFLLASIKYRIRVLGAFITPVALLFLLGAGLSTGVGRVPAEVRSVLLPVHIGLNVLGVVAFALAFAAAIGYVLQERMLRRKRLGGIFQRLPALDVLDSLGLRLVLIGFPLLTLGIVTGTIWAVRVDPQAPTFTASQAFGLVAWLVFAGVLLLRVAAGWRGRRAAIGTMVGFLCAVAVLVGYVVRAGGGA